ncbi:hypothetical protein [Cohnella faecalis]|uniref:DUF559 domain-containing protein n=1 Tax=Cohnella faecalis TaxID=2315694 RepID=A0A398CGZ1_9BACL|nr:hypothetical protein [Cohnella faecalis]RIE02013.1 hypothetical protein D3H35_14705 [Cohnella faecalis]
MEENLDPQFETAHTNWMEKQRKSARGERRRRLSLPKGGNYAELQFLARIWWPAFGQFDNLHPEYEVRDFKDGYRYLDFALLLGGLHICIEIDPYGTHKRDIDRWKYNDNLIRHDHLVLDDWRILRFSLDHIQRHPRLCQQLLQQAIGKWGMAPSTPLR